MPEQTSFFDPPEKRIAAHWSAEQLTLRPYQRACVEAVYSHLRTRDDNPCAVIPTAGGKTPIMATICKDAVEKWNGKVLILAHVKELLEQAADKLRTICRGVPIGIFSAGLGRKDVNRPITVAGIQSIYKRACDLDPFDLILIDEAHLISPDGDGMYRSFLADAKTVNPNVRICGFTATPFRMKSGPICTPDGFLNSICYEVGVRELIVDGYLSPLVTKAGLTKFDTSGLNVRGGEFVAEQVESLMDDHELIVSACKEIASLTAERKSVLIFTAGVEHGAHVASQLHALGCDCGFVTGMTSDAERFRELNRFKRGELKYLANVNVLTTGFDAPNIDCVCLLRPTNSAGLYYQMVGRGFRLSPQTGKRDCLVLDFGGNVLRHGPVDRVQGAGAKGQGAGGDGPAKECPKCNSVIAAGYATCPDCGYEFPPPEKAKHEATASDAGILSGQVTTTVHQVTEVYYAVHRKKNAADDAPRTMRVDYLIDNGPLIKSEWVCLEHEGFAKQKAVAWWRARTAALVPSTIEEAVTIAREGALAEPSEITVRTVAGEQFERIVDYKLGPLPEAAAGKNISDEIPF